MSRYFANRLSISVGNIGENFFAISEGQRTPPKNLSPIFTEFSRRFKQFGGSNRIFSISGSIFSPEIT
ncbi:hypothetical protein AYI69_g3827, partial [Smittium culicis]